MEIKASIDRSKLVSKDAFMGLLLERGAYYSGGIRYLRDLYEQEFGEDLITHYPYCDCDYRGCMLIAVQEGILMVPYDIIDSQLGEIVIIEAIRLIDDADVKTIRKQGQDHAAGFLRDMDTLSGIFAAE